MEPIIQNPVEHPDLLEEINRVKSHFGNLADGSEQVFAEQVMRLANLTQLLNLPEFREDSSNTQINEQLKEAKKAFLYQQEPYQIAFMGPVSAGKSTVANALLGGRPLLKMLGVNSVTGTVVKVFFDGRRGDEKVTITPRQEKDIRYFLEDFLQNPEVEATSTIKPSPQIDARLVQDLQKWQPGANLKLERQNYLRKLREALVITVQTYLNALSNSEGIRHQLFSEDRFYQAFVPQGNHFECSLSKPGVTEFLSELMDENSDFNKRYHRIDLVDSIAYHIETPQVGTEYLNLPPSICLVDLPGFGDNALHDIIFAKGAGEANVAVIILHPNPVLSKESYFYELVRKSFKDKSDTIFLVVNFWDMVAGNPTAVKNVEEQLDDIKDFLGGINTDYRVRAITAYCAQYALREGRMEEDLQDTYQRAASPYHGDTVQDYQKAIEQSQIPELVKGLNTFISKQFVKRQLISGQQALDQIFQILAVKYCAPKTDNRTETAKVKELLDDCCDKVVSIIVRFHKQQRSNTIIHTDSNSLRVALTNKVNNICNGIDRELEKQLPKFWGDCWKSGWDICWVGGDQLLKSDQKFLELLDKIHFLIWDKLPEGTRDLATIVRDTYLRAVQTQELESTITKHIINVLPPQVASSEDIKNLTDRINGGAKRITDALFGFSKYVALSFVTHQQAMLVKGNTPNEKKITEELNNLSNKQREKMERMISQSIHVDEKRPLVGSDFKNFIRIIRDYYEKVLTPYSVNALVRLYEYEMTRVHFELQEHTKDFFEKIRGKVSANPNLSMQIIDLAENPDTTLRDLRIKKQQAIERANCVTTCLTSNTIWGGTPSVNS